MAVIKNLACTSCSLMLIFLVTTSALELDIYRHRYVPDNALPHGPDPPDSDSVVLYKYMNAEYYSLIGVGHPSKQFKVTFDTSWGDTWLPSQHCGFTQISCLVHTRYDSSKSSTYQEDGTLYERSSKEMSLSGFFSRDNFHLEHIEVMNQTFVEVTKMSKIPFLFNKADGIVGLAYKSLSQRGTVPFFYNLLKQGAIKQPIFTFYMNRDPTTEKAGKLLLGTTERSHAKGNLTYLPVTDKTYWTVEMDRVVVDSDSKSYVYCSNTCNATLDTSSNQIIGPADEIQKINNLLHAKEIAPTWPYRYLVNCRDFAKLPHVHFVLNGKDFTIESKYYIQHMTYYGVTICLSPFTAGADNSWVLGGAFLMQFYSEFDFGKARVGIAETVF